MRHFMKSILSIIFLISFIQIFGQLPKIGKSYSIDSTIKYFIENQPDIEPNLSTIIISTFYDEKEKYFMIDLSTIYGKLQFEKKIELIYVNYKFEQFNLLLIGQNLEQIKFLKKIIKGLRTSKSNLEFIGHPKVAVTNDPYSMYLDYDLNMNLKNAYITEDINSTEYATKIKIIEELNRK